MRFYDAHNHLHDARLTPHREGILSQLRQLPMGRAVVNGTREEDWQEVSELARQLPWVLPSFGLHPWYVGKCSSGWLDRLKTILEENSRAAVGEIGLDRWIEGHDLQVQIPIFTQQLALAAQLNRPATVHCVRAWGALWDIVRTSLAPERGFLLHAYAGPAEMVQGFVSRGAYFSFSTYFLHERKHAQREAFRTIPLDRLLVETDAPDMAPPTGEHTRTITGDRGEVLNHPANIELAYLELAKLRGMPLSDLAAEVEANFQRLFGS